MTLAILFLVTGAGLFVLAWRQLRGAQRGDWVRSAGTRIVVAASRQDGRQELRMMSGTQAVFGPVSAHWDPTPAIQRAFEADGAGAPLARGTYEVIGMVDLGAPDALGTGDERLAAAIQRSFGHAAMILRGPDDRMPALLHGLPQGGSGGAGGVGVARVSLDALVALTGDPQGMRVDVERRRIRRDGWGTPQTPRRRRV